MFKVLVLQTLQPVGQSGGVPDPGPAFLYALPGPWAGRSRAGRQDDLAVSGPRRTGGCR